jgi:hypothetical protein
MCSLSADNLKGLPSMQPYGWRVCVVPWVASGQMPLMSVLGIAMAALDSHRGVAAIAEQGMTFLHYLSGIPEYRSKLRASGVKARVHEILALHRLDPHITELASKLQDTMKL